MANGDDMDWMPSADWARTAGALPVDAVAARLDVDPRRGLTAAEARRRLARAGPNLLQARAQKGLLTILGHQFASVIVWLLAGAAALSLAMGDLAEAAAILTVLAINGAIGFFTELRAARSMEGLMRIAAVRARVRRDGSERLVEARELVPGDVVVLEAGDIVPADLRLAEVAQLQADESALTGESLAVTKTTAPTPPGTSLGDRTNMAFKGTAITRGSGEGIVVATGMATEIGKISDLAQRAEGEAAPLERRLDALGHRLVWLTLALAGLTIAAGIAQGYGVVAMVQTGIALAIAAVPEGLPVVATLSLARGMWRMSRRNAVIRRLSSVETLGATTVILTDKTGTLTENRMTAVRYLLEGADVDVEDGAFRCAGADVRAETDERLAWALRVGALCTNADLGDGSEDGHAGDPMEVALLAAADAGGLSRRELLETWPEVAEHAFDPVHKMMATVHRGGAGEFLVAVKGAPESVLEVCSSVLDRNGPRPLERSDRAAWAARGAAAARDGLRLLAVAMKRTPTQAQPFGDLVLIGMVGLADPLRRDVPAAIAAARAAGVRVVMMTGDHAETARAIAMQAGLADGDIVVIGGGEVDRLDPRDRAAVARILAADVFARVSPETKLRLVALFQQAGHVVAMTGDGVNDAPALKKADIGVAMGLRGTQVAQQAAHMVLRDDSFATIVAAMRQGRVIYGNIRKFVVYLMSCNVSEVLVVGLAVGGGLPAPLLPLQILFLNLVTDVFPAFALGLGRGDGDEMRRPPRQRDESIVDRGGWTMIAAFGAAITAATLAAFALALFWLGLDEAQAVTVAFLTLALAQVLNVFNVRQAGSSPWRNDVTRNPFVWGAIALCLGLVGGALWFPPLADLLGLADPTPRGLGLSAAASLVPLALGQASVWAWGRVAARKAREA